MEELSENVTGNYSMIMTTAATTMLSSTTALPVNITTILPIESTTSNLYNETAEAFTTSLTTSNLQNISRQSWNLTRVGDAFPKIDTTTVTSNLCTTTMATTTEVPFDEFGPPDGVEYIFVPLGVMIFVIVLSAVVIVISRKRKLERLRHRLMPLYNFDPGEEGEDDWETELLDEGFVNRQRRQGYQSMDSDENAELFSPARSHPLG
ncbi:uncharacterized protein C3orf18 homolog [Phymastichus coffea]|uniref:uncharacterized protein C3orf18 homolog n=1 Tax=Phymastichus coffea TaxID=108790 RepID=UPI00273BE0DA|nr:uncharacterized protein C3orf18 homolog [Phymastichus coffea]